MKQYLDMLRHINQNGVYKEDRTGVGTKSVFGYQMRINLADGFPLLTTKKVYLKAIIYELLWFLKGDTNIRYLAQNGVNIWNEWAFEGYRKTEPKSEALARYSPEWQEALKEFVEKIKTDEEFAKQWGELGPIYGKQWVSWEGKNGEKINQVDELINLIRKDPTSRRLIISGWNVGEIQDLIRSHHGAPPPCHTLFQFMVVNGKLSLQLYQRSADAFLGVPFNIASYALLLMMVAQITGLEPGEFIHTFGDLHIYRNHEDQVAEQLSRSPRALPKIKLNSDIKSIYDFDFKDFELSEYDPHPPIKGQIAV